MQALQCKVCCLPGLGRQGLGALVRRIAAVLEHFLERTPVRAHLHWHADPGEPARWVKAEGRAVLAMCSVTHSRQAELSQARWPSLLGAGCPCFPCTKQTR